MWQNNGGSTLLVVAREPPRNAGRMLTSPRASAKTQILLSAPGGRHIYVAQRLFVLEGVTMTKEHHKDEALTLSVEHAARLIGISRTTAYRMVQSGDLPALRVGRRVLILKKPLMEMLEAEEHTE
jgi:excisionase family DNA binding protein